MKNWKNFEGDKDNWENHFDLYSDTRIDFRQSYMWGEYLKDNGWCIKRKELLTNNDKILIQYRYKKIWPVVAIYITGINIFTIKHLPSLVDHIKLEFKYHLIYLRFDSHDNENTEAINTLKSINFKKPIYSIRSTTHAVVDLKKEYDEILLSTKQKWRYNFKRALKKPVSIETSQLVNTKEILDISNELSQFKKIKNVYSLKELRSYKKNLEEIVINVKAKNTDQKIVGYYMCIKYRDNAFQIFNAVNREGNELMSGYTILMFLLRELKNKGVKKLYLGELNKKKFPGNFQFKSSFNQEIVKIIGEYDYASNFFVRIFFNIYLYFYK